MTRVYRPESGSKIRKKIMRRMAAAINATGAEGLSKAEQLDILTYLNACLAEIDRTIHQTVEAWENRGYWVKADRFGMEWGWVQHSMEQVSNALKKEDMSAATGAVALIAEKLGGTDPYRKDQVEQPWRGSWERLNDG